MSVTRFVLIVLLAFLLTSLPLPATLACPEGDAPNTLFPLLGTTYEFCGEGSYGPTIVASVPGGEPAADVGAWLGLDLLGYKPEYGTPIEASAILFPLLLEVPDPSFIGLNWTVEPEPDAMGYVFAAIDQSIIWDESYGVILPSGYGSMDIGGNATLQIGPGNHSLALGIVMTCNDCSVEDFVDPPFSFTLTGPTTFSPSPRIPEPATIALVGFGLGLLGLLRRRRRN